MIKGLEIERLPWIMQRMEYTELSVITRVLMRGKGGTSEWGAGNVTAPRTCSSEVFPNKYNGALIQWGLFMGSFPPGKDYAGAVIAYLHLFLFQLSWLSDLDINPGCFSPSFINHLDFKSCPWVFGFSSRIGRGRGRMQDPKRRSVSPILTSSHPP